MRITGLAQEVARLEKQRDDAIDLLSTVLATITIDGNKRYFAAFPDDWRVLVDSWVSEFQSIKAAQQGVHPTAAGGSTGDNDSESVGG
jgi:hypothetical protein